MKICDFTKPKLDLFRKECNFTKDEMALFELRRQEIPLEECAEIMNLSISAVKSKSRKINEKIQDVLLVYFP